MTQLSTPFPPPDETAYVHVRGLPLAVHAWGPPQAPVLLCIHGFLDLGQAFAPLAANLPELRLVAPDLRGHGHSGWIGAGGDYHIYDYHHDLVATVQALGLQRFDLLGHSLGGMLAAVLAGLEPERVRSLVLLDGMGPPAQGPAIALERVKKRVQALQMPGYASDEPTRRHIRRPMPDRGAAARRLMDVNPRLSAAVAAHLAAVGTELHPDGKGVTWRHDPLHRTPSPRPFRADEGEVFWRALHLPVLSIYADQSQWRPDDLAARHACLPQAVVATLPDASHNFHHEQPDLLARIVRQWLDRPGALPEGLLPGLHEA